MGAVDRWHEHGPVKDGDPIISPSILPLMQGQGGSEQSVLPWEADREVAFDSESMPEGGPESEDVLANLLRAIENTDIAASFPSVTPTENGHPPALTSAPTGEIAEAVPTLLQEPLPEADAAAPLESTPQGALETGESAAGPMGAFVNAEAAARLDDAPAQFDEESSEIAPFEEIESAETASILEPPVVSERRKKLRQQDRHPKRVVRRRNSNRRRSNYLLSIAAPTEAPAPAVADSQAAEPVAGIINSTIEEPPPVAVEPEPTEAVASEPPETLAFALAPAIPEPPTSIELLPTKVIEPWEPAKQAEPAEQAELTEPAEPAGAVAATVTEEPESPLAAEPAFIDDTPILPAAAEDATPKMPSRVRLGTGIGSLAATGDLINGGLDRAEMHLENWFQKWLGPPDPRRATRVSNPPLVAYHWIADVPQALKIADVGAGGLHLITKDRWSEGNIVSMTLQRTDRDKGSPDSWIAVDFLVMRWCEDGMAGAFIASTPGLYYTVAGRAGNCADRKTLERFMERLANAAADRLAVCR